MRILLACAAAAIAGIAVCSLPAAAADGAEYMNECRAGANSAQLPSGVTKDDIIDFCQCMVDEIGDNQSAIDELVAMSKLTPDERRAKFEAGERPSKAVQEAFTSCAPDEWKQPPQQ